MTAAIDPDQFNPAAGGAPDRAAAAESMDTQLEADASAPRTTASLSGNAPLRRSLFRL
jgi:hypothetical protein